MEKKYMVQRHPFVVPTNDGKSIKEHFGLATTNNPAFSVAHMIAPPGWSEPYQTPEFDEVTLVVRGRKQISINEEETIVLGPGESILIQKGCRVQYANPFDEATEYVSFCVPAFSLDLVHREP